MSASFTLPFIKKEQVAKETYSFYFDKTKNPDYVFRPGQYTRVTLPITPTDDKGSFRYFTTCSSPLEHYLLITTKISDDPTQVSDFKKYFFNLKPGEDVQFFGPMGGFLLSDEDTTPRVLLAGGIGITPFHSMVTFAAKKQLQIPLTLFVSFSTFAEAVFLEELQSAEKENPNIKIIYTITHPEKSSWQAETGRISDVLIKKYIQDLSKPIFMIAGPPKMVDAAVDLLQKMGIEEGKIKVDHFTGY